MMFKKNRKKSNLIIMLKALTSIAIVVLFIALFQSLLPFANEKKPTDKVTLEEIDLSNMRQGEIRKIRWQGREVAILKRKKTEVALIKDSTVLAHQSLHSGSRSRLAEYFVYFNTGDSKNCPLFYDSNGFKDICSGKQFDETGREKNNPQRAFKIQIPPHNFKRTDSGVSTLVIGQW